MTGRLLPLSLWQMPDQGSSDFTLPGMEELQSFSALWEGEEEMPSRFPEDSRDTRPFSAPGLLPRETGGDLTLTCPLPPVRPGQHTFLTVPPLMGRGTLSLNGTPLLSFCSFPESGAQEPVSCQRELDLTEQLPPERRNTLELRFEPFRPAGICDLFVLRTVDGGRIQLTAARRDRARITCTCLVHVYLAGTYCIHVTELNGNGAPPDESFAVSEPGTRSFSFTLPLKRSETVYYRFQLMRGSDVLDTLTLPAGPGPRRHDAGLPVPAGDAVLYPPDLVRMLREIGKPALFSALPLSRGCVEALTEAGIPLILPPDAPHLPPEYAVHPNIRFDPAPATLCSGAASAWQLCGLLLSPRPVQSHAVPDLLEEVFGHRAMAMVRPTHLAKLHLLHIRLHAELVRQGLGTGALCAAAEWDDPGILAVLAEVFRPVHLSLAPLRGAFFTSSTLPVSLRVFLTEEYAGQEGSVLLRLTRPGHDEETNPLLLYEETLPVSALLSENRLIRIPLPDTPCICRLSGQFTLGESVTESVSVPVCVGREAPLEQVLLSEIPDAPDLFS
ncbi:MAG: hypothetical protein IJ088_00590 [Clostridia bacterium]|nr:hypothetical protein [Clostridia bacterium]